MEPMLKSMLQVLDVLEVSHTYIVFIDVCHCHFFIL